MVDRIEELGHMVAQMQREFLAQRCELEEIFLFVAQQFDDPLATIRQIRKMGESNMDAKIANNRIGKGQEAGDSAASITHFIASSRNDFYDTIETTLSLWVDSGNSPQRKN